MGERDDRMWKRDVLPFPQFLAKRVAKMWLPSGCVKPPGCNGAVNGLSSAQVEAGRREDSKLKAPIIGSVMIISRHIQISQI